MKTGQTRSFQGLEKLGRHLVAIPNSSSYLIDWVSKNNNFVSERYLTVLNEK